MRRLAGRQGVGTSEYVTSVKGREKGRKQDWHRLHQSARYRRSLSVAWYKTHCKIAWNLLFINSNIFCYTKSMSVYPMSILLYVFTLHIFWASIYVSVCPYICLSHVKKPFYCLTSKMRWFTLTQNYKYWEWDKILYFEKNQKLASSFLMSLIFFKLQNFTPFSIFMIQRKGKSFHFACQTVKWFLNVWQTNIWTNRNTDKRQKNM